MELYDLANDPGEHNNIAAQKPEIVEKMMTRIGEWRKDMNVMMAEEKTMHLTDSMNKNNKNAK